MLILTIVIWSFLFEISFQVIKRNNHASTVAMNVAAAWATLGVLIQAIAIVRLYVKHSYFLMIVVFLVGVGAIWCCFSLRRHGTEVSLEARRAGYLQIKIIAWCGVIVDIALIGAVLVRDDPWVDPILFVAPFLMAAPFIFAYAIKLRMEEHLEWQQQQYMWHQWNGYGPAQGIQDQ
ncbi:hypothetical protein KEM60_01521 [Austwickia sp. TVS 96-490-7B]|uniref:hypothetical protein n=1 Tax=Austwickia sp. TVS 96-490-7B TaxID=2830843 RepID=UPI001C57A660|nr:hypothetical protein [Austwickia sp. TVS 96-490-7B]MBW3085324.1 hypothetical protein [Austwickia sp. TVS 96-490-7B]